MTSTRDESSEMDRWSTIVAAEARGEAISRDDAELRRRFEKARPDVVKEEVDLWAGLGALGEPRGDGAEVSDAELLARVFSQAAAGVSLGAPLDPVLQIGSVLQRDRSRPRMRRGVAGAFAGLALAAALAAAAAELLRTDERGPAGQREPASVPSAIAAIRKPWGRGGEPFKEATPAPGPEPAGDLGTGEKSSGSSGDEPSGAAPSGPPDAVRGEARSSGASGGAGLQGRSAEPRESADGLLKTAQTLLGEGRTQDAIGAYKNLLSRYPTSVEARAALVSLGRLSLGKGNASEALGYFDRYLGGAGGPLSVEARYGRIQALRRLGRSGDELSAIQDFLSRHGDSVYAPRLRARIEGASPAPARGPSASPGNQ